MLALWIVAQLNDYINAMKHDEMNQTSSAHLLYPPCRAHTGHDHQPWHSSCAIDPSNALRGTYLVWWCVLLCQCAGVKGTGCVLCEYAGGRQAECCLCCRSPRTGWAAADLLSLGCSCFPSAAIAVICISPALIEMLLSSSHQHHPPCTAASPPFPICSLLHHHICVSGGCPGEGELYIAATQCAGDIWRHGGVSSWQSQTYHSCTAGIIGNVTSL